MAVIEKVLADQKKELGYYTTYTDVNASLLLTIISIGYSWLFQLMPQKRQ
jgi:hypothetical protein